MGINQGCKLELLNKQISLFSLRYLKSEALQ
jgi:hypothetical protein